MENLFCLIKNDNPFVQRTYPNIAMPVFIDAGDGIGKKVFCWRWTLPVDGCFSGLSVVAIYPISIGQHPEQAFTVLKNVVYMLNGKPRWRSQFPLFRVIRVELVGAEPKGALAVFKKHHDFRVSRQVCFEHVLFAVISK